MHVLAHYWSNKSLQVANVYAAKLTGPAAENWFENKCVLQSQNTVTQNKIQKKEKKIYQSIELWLERKKTIEIK